MHTIRLEERYPLAYFETYMAVIEGSIGTKMFRRLYITIAGAVGNIMYDPINDGDLASAFYWSSLNTLFGLTMGGVHTTVDYCEADLYDPRQELAKRWYQIPEPIPGATLIWERQPGDDGLYRRHIGFFVGDRTAISTCPRAKSPQRHHFSFGTKGGRPNRLIEAIYFNPMLRRN